MNTLTVLSLLLLLTATIVADSYSSDQCQYENQCRVVRCSTGIARDHNGCAYRGCPCNWVPPLRKRASGGCQCFRAPCDCAGCPLLTCSKDCSKHGGWIVDEDNCNTCTCRDDLICPACATPLACAGQTDKRGCPVCSCPKAEEHAGSCPSTRNPLIGGSCRYDGQCDDEEKCCEYGGRQICQDAVFLTPFRTECLCVRSPCQCAVCPTLECAKDCSEHGGYVVGENNCFTCQCRDDTPVSCPDIACRDLNCRSGRKKDSNGCDTCECAGCVLPECVSRMTCLGGFKRDANGCTICECQDAIIPCPDLACEDSNCRFGRKKDSNGCLTCECARCILPECVSRTTCFGGFKQDRNGCIRPTCECKDSQPRSKPGTCPQLRRVGRSENCQDDQDCAGRKKCCTAGAGTVCVRPVSAQGRIQTNPRKRRLMSCAPRPFQFTFCRSTDKCSSDDECSRTELCCGTSCPTCTRGFGRLHGRRALRNREPRNREPRNRAPNPTQSLPY